MIEKIIFPLLCILIIGGYTATASSFVDDFTGYDSNYMKIDSMDTNASWVKYSDATAIGNYTQAFKEGSGAIIVNFTPTTTRSAIYKTISSINLTAMDNVGFWSFVENSSMVSRIELRVGNSSANYREYRNLNIDWDGWLYNEFNISAPTSTVGSPNFSDIKYIWVAYYNASGDTNTYWLVDDLWAYKNQNFAYPTWYYILSSNLYGIAEINVSGTERLLIPNHNNRPNSGNHGRLLYNTTTPDFFNLSVKGKFINDRNSTGWIRALFDFTDGQNFSSVYISREFHKAGVEQYVNNVRNYWDIDFYATTGTEYVFNITVQNNFVELQINGTDIGNYTLSQTRAIGGFGLESYGGNVNNPLNSSTAGFYYFNITSSNNNPVLSSIGNKSVVAGDPLNFTLSATDTDGDTLIYGTNATKGTLNTTTGNFNWSTEAADAGTYYWQFNVSDGNVTDSENIAVTVSAAPSTTESPSSSSSSSSSSSEGWGYIPSVTPTAKDTKYETSFRLGGEDYSSRHRITMNGASEHGIQAANIYLTEPYYGTFTLILTTHSEFTPELPGAYQYFSMSQPSSEPALAFTEKSNIEIATKYEIEVYRLSGNKWQKLPGQFSGEIYTAQITAMGDFAIVRIAAHAALMQAQAQGTQPTLDIISLAENNKETVAVGGAVSMIVIIGIAWRITRKPRRKIYIYQR